MKKIRVSSLASSLVREASVRVSGWVPAGCDPGTDKLQEYELILPHDLDHEVLDELDDWSPRELTAWIKRYDVSRTDYVDRLLLKHPRAGTQAYEAWVEDLRDVVRESLEDARQDYEESGAPMMNYYYPLGRYVPGEDPAVLAGTCCSLVHLPDEDIYALVLNGGGMDLSWEIALAHIRLGYLPPAWVSLPQQAGYPKQAKLIMAACALSQRILEAYAKCGLNHLQRVRADVKKQAQR